MTTTHTAPAQRTGGTGARTAPPRPSHARWTPPTRPWEPSYLRRLVAIDLLAGTAAAAIAYLLRFGPVSAPYTTFALMLSLFLPFVWVAVMAMLRAYETRMLFVGMDEFHGTVRAGARLTIATVLASYGLHAEVARGYLLIVCLLTTTLSMAGRFALRRRLHQERARGTAMRRVLAVGHAGAVAELTRQLSRRRHHGMEVVAACVPVGEALSEIAIPVVYGPEQAAAAATASRADTVVVLATPHLYGAALRRLAWDLEVHDIDLMTAPSLLDTTGDRLTVRPVDGLALMHIEHATLTGPRRAVKSIVETATAAVLLSAAAPVLLIIAALIKLDSPGPVLYRQTRVGRNGAAFPMIKFRTMAVDAHLHRDELPQGDSVLFKLREDPRVTRIGRRLRRYSLDELPQLINVLRGEMSLVGPRPPLHSEVARYGRDMRRRLVVKPGMTGLWQVSGRSDLPWDEAVRLDLRYVENWSLTFDITILLRTFVAVFRGSGAY